jgi:hypothetical protein
MKKILALLLVLVMACTVLTACGGSGKPSAAPSATSESKPTQSSAAATPKEEAADEDEGGEEEYEDEDENGEEEYEDEDENGEEEYEDEDEGGEEEYADEDEGGEEEYADEGGDADEYLDVMNSFVASFKDLMVSLEELLALSDEISTEDDLYAWCEMFDGIKATVGASADELANVAEYAPEEYQESHVAVTIAVAAVYDAMTGFEDAVVGAISGDADAFETGMAEFAGNIIAAEELWQSAVES